MSTTATHDTDLLAQAANGDLEALRAVVDRHLHPAWRIASVAAGDPERAQAATVDGIVVGLLAAARQPDTAGLRVRLVGAARRAAVASATAAGATTPAPTSDDPVIAAFLALPEKSRTALWLTEVEGGTPEQVAPVLGLDRSAAAALADRAALALRERLATNVAARAPSECRSALTKLPAHAAGRLTAAEQAKVGEHVGTCGSCAVWLASLVAPRPALRRLVAEPPVAAITAEIEARWFEHLQRERTGWLAPFTERAIGAAAAAVLAIGLGGVAFLGDRTDDDQDRRSELALPASVDPNTDSGTGTGTDSDEVAAPPTSEVTPTPPPSTTTTTTPAADSGGGTTTTTAPPRARGGDDPVPPPAGQPDPTPPPPPPLPPTPSDDDTSTQLAVSLLDGAVALGVGDCTGLAIGDLELGCVPPSSAAPLSIVLDLPGVDPIGI